jgi:hypothetical protein
METVGSEGTITINGSATLPIAELEFLRKIERDNTILVKHDGCGPWGCAKWVYFGKDEFIAKAARDVSEAEKFLETYTNLFTETQAEKARLIDASLGARLRFLFTGKR